MKRHVTTLFILILAIVFYAVGAVGPGTFLLILGGLTEAIFWFRLFGGNKVARKNNY